MQIRRFLNPLHHKVGSIKPASTASDDDDDVVERNHTWQLLNLPESKLTIGCRWAFKTELRPDGTMDK